MLQPITARTVPRPRRSWQEAFLAFIKDQHASTILKLAFGLGPLTVLDDIIPGIGLLDDPLIPVWLIVIVVVFFKVRSYRYLD